MAKANTINAQKEEQAGNAVDQDEEQSGNAGEGVFGPETSPVKGIVVVSESRKGKTIVAASGDPIVFDAEGKAMVSEMDALYLKSCPGFIVG
jgi:hypothetical protein